MHKRLICTLLTAGILLYNAPKQQIPVTKTTPSDAVLAFNQAAESSTTTATISATKSTAITATTKAESKSSTTTTAAKNTSSTTVQTSTTTTKTTSSATSTTAAKQTTTATTTSLKTETNTASSGTTKTGTTGSTTKATTAVTNSSIKVEAKAEFSRGYPGKETTLTLYLQGNPGLNALGMTIELPEILTAEADKTGKTIIEKTGAIPENNLLSFYDAEHKIISIAFASETTGSADAMICQIPLHIENTAEWGKEYPVKLTIDSMETGKAVTYEKDVKTKFIPDESPKRTLSAEKMTLTEYGEEQTLKLSPEPEEKSCKWESSNPEIIAVDANGNITAKAPGNAKITVTCEKRTYTCNVTVKYEYELTPDAYTAKDTGETVQLKLKPDPKTKPKWASANEEILTTNADGIATIHRNGTAHIKAVIGEKEYHYLFPVIIPRKLNFTNIATDDPTRTYSLKLNPSPLDQILFSSENPEIASVTKDGIVTLLKNGKTTITANCEGIQYACNLNLQLITCLNHDTCAATKSGQQFQLCLLPKSQANEKTVWTSSNESVAKVTGYGLVTVKEQGTAIITAESEGKKYQCKIFFLPYLLGDVNSNAEVSVDDAQNVLQYYVSELAQVKGNLNAQEILAADVDKNSTVDIIDANAILRYYVMRMANQNPDWSDIISMQNQT